MFGRNPKRPAVNGDGSSLDIKNIFATIQGEGPLAGAPAVFIRLGGCNLACNFCDTEFEDYKSISQQQILNEVKRLSCDAHHNNIIKLVVITGGEPLRQPIEKLCQALIEQGYMVQIETNGTLYRELPEEIQIVCSPKSSKNGYSQVRDDLLKRVTALKFLISCKQPYYDKVPEVGQSKYNIPVFIQPMDEIDPSLNKNNEKLAIELSMMGGYRLSYQLHKILGIE